MTWAVADRVTCQFECQLMGTVIAPRESDANLGVVSSFAFRKSLTLG